MRFIPAVLVAILACPAHADLGDQLFKLLPDDGAPADEFGVSVSLSGSTALVGAWGHDPIGAAYLFDLSIPSDPVQLHKLVASDGSPGEGFGGSVSLSGSLALVSARTDNTANGDRAGSVYLFDATTGLEIGKIEAGDGSTGDQFGFSVAIDGTTAVVGAPFDDDNGLASGSAYLINAATGEQIAKLLPSDGAAGARFGFSVAISGSIAVVGAWRDNANGIDSGSAYLFDTTTGKQLAALRASDGAPGDRFGTSVAISGATVVIGAGLDDDNGDASGSAYIFDASDPNEPIEVTKLFADDGTAGDRLGRSISVSGSVTLVGAFMDDDRAADSGSAYLFDTQTGEQLAKFLAADRAEGDQAGFSVSVSGRTAVVGSWKSDAAGVDSGSVFVFDANTCGADIDGNGVVDADDFFAYLDLFASGDDRADIDGDGDLDSFDFFAYLNLFVQPCQ